MSTNPDRSRASAFGLIKEREQSGSFPIGERAEDSQRLESDLVIAELAPDLVSLIPEPPLEARRNFAPPPRNPTPSERAELVIEDLSLQLDNPYLASSLVPPPKQSFPMRRVLAIGSGMLAAVAIGAVIQLSVLRSGHRTEVNAGAAGIAAAAPIAAVGAVASAKQPAQREIAVAPQPDAVLPTPVAPIEVAPAPVVAAVAPAAVAPKVEQPKVEQPSAVAVVSPAAPARIARVVPPAPLEPSVPVAEAAMPMPAAPAADLPEYPTREQVTAGFESVRAELSQCAAGRSGTVQINASIASTGRIVHALVGGDFRGTVEGSCMARAVREAQFPAFSQARLKVSYPISL